MKLKIIVALVALAFVLDANANPRGRGGTDPNSNNGAAHAVGAAATNSSAKDTAAKVRSGLAQKGLLNESIPAQKVIAEKLEAAVRADTTVARAIIGIVNSSAPNLVKTQQLTLLSVAEKGDLRADAKGKIEIVQNSTAINIPAEKARIQILEIGLLVAPEVLKFAEGPAKTEGLQMLTLVSETILQGKSNSDALKNVQQDVIDMICKCTGRCG